MQTLLHVLLYFFLFEVLVYKVGRYKLKFWGKRLCSFGVTSVAKDLLDVNYFAQFRGPDDTEVLTIENIQFIHNALYITGDRVSQPFYKDGIVIVFNGEIYNYQEHGDYKSEVDAIFNAYVSEGAAAFRSFDGEFALCLVDFPKDKIIFTTDTFATKPLWYDFTRALVLESPLIKANS